MVLVITLAQESVVNTLEHLLMVYVMDMDAYILAFTAEEPITKENLEMVNPTATENGLQEIMKTTLVMKVGGNMDRSNQQSS